MSSSGQLYANWFIYTYAGTYLLLREIIHPLTRYPQNPSIFTLVTSSLAMVARDNSGNSVINVSVPMGTWAMLVISHKIHAFSLHTCCSLVALFLSERL